MAILALKFLCKNRSGQERLVTTSASHFRMLWHRAVRFFALDDFFIQPYSLRRGGATSSFRRGISFEQLLVRGRWSHQRTARIYFDEALQQSSALSFSHVSLRRLAWARQRLPFGSAMRGRVDRRAQR